ncbi:MAG: M20/M25/M40 family metallo-hydrolase [Candidatus Binataceae bacterium]
MAGPLTLLIIAACALWTIRASAPPAPPPADAAAGHFSATRAIRDVRVIAQRPHPIGTGDHARVRYYLLARLRELGFRPMSHAQIVARREHRGPDLFANVRNVSAEMKGADSTGAVMLVAHYDSVPSGPGAGDDASGVAAILETIRAIRAGAPLRNDLIVLFTDGEELGLLGAKAFVENLAPPSRIKAVLNFDMRGNSGPVWMFQASAGNGWFIDELAKAAPDPRAASFAADIYRHMSNDSDFTVFAKAGMGGLNFAGIGGLPNYHTRLDSPARLDLRTLQHQGSYALSLTRWLGSVALDNTSAADAVFFTVGSRLTHYRAALALPFAIGVAVLVILAALIVVVRSGNFSAVAVLVGFAAFVASAIIAVLQAWVGWHAMAWVAGDRMLPAGTTYGGAVFAAAILTVIATSLWTFYVWLARRFDELSLGGGVLVAWALVMLVGAVRMVGASYLLTWPLLFAAIALRWRAYDTGGQRTPVPRSLVVLVGVVPGVILIAPLLAVTADGTMLFLLLESLLLALMFALIAPHTRFLSGATPALLAVMLAAAGVLLFAWGYLASGFGPSQPRPDSILYNLNANTNTAVFASFDAHPDHWTAQFLKHNPRMSSVASLAGATIDGPIPVLRGTAASPASALRALGGRRLIVAKAPSIQLAPPQLTVVDDLHSGDQRIVMLRIKSARAAPVVMVVVEPGVAVRSAAVSGKSPAGTPSDGWVGWFWDMADDGFDLHLTVHAHGTFKVTVTDSTWGLPEIAGHGYSARPADTMPQPWPVIDSTTQVTRTFKVGSADEVR